MRRLAGRIEVADTTLNIPHPYEEGEAERWIGTHAAGFADGRLAVFAVERKADGRLVGSMGLDLRLVQGKAELGYWVGLPYWGNGYATEAGLEMLRYAFGTLGLARVCAHHMARNPASGRVLEKIGMTREGLLRKDVRKWDRREDLVVWGILREEFEVAGEA